MDEALMFAIWIFIGIIFVAAVGGFIWYIDSKDTSHIRYEDRIITIYINDTNNTQGTPSNSNDTVNTTIISFKTENCTVNDVLPDRECTPGSVYENLTLSQLCTVGYTATVRNVTEKVRQQVFTMYKFTNPGRGNYELDHLISLELGGDNSIQNLWPETTGYKDKDNIENCLHRKVCNNEMTMEQAQKLIAINWTRALSICK